MRGQSTLEYIIIFAVIIAAVLISSNYIRARTADSLTHVITEIQNAE